MEEVEKKIPKYVTWVSEKLAKEGYEVYMVGGCVRDLIRGDEPKDYDLATNAKPKEIQKLFPDSIAVGAAFGIITVVAPGEGGEQFEVEVATYRTEEDYVDGRWPTKVEFTVEITKDLGRRDFTFNAMAYPLHLAKEKRKILDPFEGQADLGKKVIRAVGDPMERLNEDGLRGFRACRMASNWGFGLDSELKKAISGTVDVARQVSMERIRDEFMRLLLDSPVPSVGIELLRETGLLEIFLPELVEGLSVGQSKRGVQNVYEHALRSVDKAVDRVKLAALLHDIAKPKTKSKDGQHFYNHEVVGARMVRDILRRLKFPNAEIKRVCTLVRNHMFWYNENWTDAAVRRLIRRVGGEEMIEQLLELRMADSQSDPKSDMKPWVVEKLQERIAKIRKEEMALSVSDLVIGGKDVIQLGVPKDLRVRVILDYLLDQVVEDPSLNNKEHLTKEVKKYLDADCELLQLVDDNDKPVSEENEEKYPGMMASKGYLEDAKKYGLGYRWVVVEAEVEKKAEKKIVDKAKVEGHCFPDESYRKAAKRLVWEQLEAQTSKERMKLVEKTEEKDSEGVTRFVRRFAVKAKTRMLTRSKKK